MPQYSPYVAQIASEISSLRDRVGLKVAKLWRKDHAVFGEPQTAPDAALRLLVRQYLAEAVEDRGVSADYLEWLKADEEALHDFMYYMGVMRFVHTHFEEEIQALRRFLADVLASPKRKHVRHALKLPKFATPALYQAAIHRSLLWGCFVEWSEEAASDEGDDHERSTPPHRPSGGGGAPDRQKADEAADDPG